MQIVASSRVPPSERHYSSILSVAAWENGVIPGEHVPPNRQNRRSFCSISCLRPVGCSWRMISRSRRQGAARALLIPDAFSTAASWPLFQVIKELTSRESSDESQAVVLALDSFYQKGWLNFYKKRDFVRKSFGCLELGLVILCIVPIFGQCGFFSRRGR